MTRMSSAIRIVPIWFYNTQSFLILYEVVQKKYRTINKYQFSKK